MKKENLKKTYEVNIQLNSLYDVLDSLYSKAKYWYPNDIKDSIEFILKRINEYNYNGYEKMDVVNEKFFHELELKKEKF